MGNLLGADPTDIAAILGAVAGLGTAASGLVDTTKVFGGGISVVGYGTIKKAVGPFGKALTNATGSKAWSKPIKGAWINGMPMEDQITKAKALVHLALTTVAVADLPGVPSVDQALLAAIATSLDAGVTPLPADQQAGLNRFDGFLDLTFRGAYERADQLYRNAAKFLAAVLSIALAATAGGMHFASLPKDHSTISYTSSHEFVLALIVGMVAVPLAPIAKDLASSLTAAVTAMKSAGG